VRKNLFLLIAVLLCGTIHAQERVTTFGIVVKPIFPSSYFRTGPKEATDNNIKFTLSQYSGFSAGGVIRKGINKTLSLETGISYVKRLYNLEIKDTSATISSDFKIIGYEIPVQALVFIRLSKEIWMDAALGPSIDIFPSDVRTRNNHFLQETRRKSQQNIFNLGLIANIGWEWRTAKSGYIYAGGSYHRSFSNPYTTSAVYIRDVAATKPDGLNTTPLAGDYLTFDIRYYFHEDPKPKKVKKQ
jgi:hypothetical protein